MADCPAENQEFGSEKWTDQRGDQHCFLWSNKTRNWADAEDFCKGQGGHLASVTSKAINEYIVDGKMKRKISSLWVGGTDKEKEGFWTWTDCSTFRDHRFTAWAHHQPSNGKDQDCVDHWSRSWNDVDCSREKHFLCAKKLCPYVCPDNAKLTWNQVSGHVLVKCHIPHNDVKVSTPYLQVCDHYSKTSSGGEDEEVCRQKDV